MKMVEVKTFFIISLLFVITTLFIKEVSSSSSPRVPRSIGGIIRRLISGRRKQTGFQGTAQVQHPYMFGSSSNYPSYAQYPFTYPGYSYSPGYGYAYNPSYQGYAGYPGLSAASSQYSPSYAASPYGQSPYSSSGTLDLHQVLDQLVRSAGLSPQGDHEAQASTLQSKGDSMGNSPVFSFKKLYSFPFYLSSDSSAVDGYNLHVPFLKRHIKRMSAENHLYHQAQPIEQGLTLKQLQQQQQPQFQAHTQPLTTQSTAQNDYAPVQQHQ